MQKNSRVPGTNGAVRPLSLFPSLSLSLFIFKKASRTGSGFFMVLANFPKNLDKRANSVYICMYVCMFQSCRRCKSEILLIAHCFCYGLLLFLFFPMAFGQSWLIVRGRNSLFRHTHFFFLPFFLCYPRTNTLTQAGLCRR